MYDTFVQRQSFNKSEAKLPVLVFCGRKCDTTGIKWTHGKAHYLLIYLVVQCVPELTVRELAVRELFGPFCRTEKSSFHRITNFTRTRLVSSMPKAHACSKSRTYAKMFVPDRPRDVLAFIAVVNCVPKFGPDRCGKCACFFDFCRTLTNCAELF